MFKMPEHPSAKAGWSLSEFTKAACIGRSSLYALIQAKDPRAPAHVHLGRRLIVIERPEAWLQRLAGHGRAPVRGTAAGA